MTGDAQVVATDVRRQRRIADVDQGYVVAVIAVVLALVLAASVDGFARTGNLVNIGRAVAGLGILALAQAIVVLGRGLDLSVVAIYGVTAQMVSELYERGHGNFVALICGLGVALLLGAINGAIVAYVDVPPLFVTLATSLLYLGFFRLVFFNSAMEFTFPSRARFVDSLGAGETFGIPNGVLLWVGCALVCSTLLRVTAVGRMLHASGDNPEAARLIGMPTRPITLATYVVSGALAFAAGLVLAGAAGTFDMRIVFAGEQLYDVLAIVVIGGVSLAGGRGGLFGVVAATLLIGIILNAMTLLNIGDTRQSIIKSLIVLGALVLDRFLHPPNDETARPGEL